MGGGGWGPEFAGDSTCYRAPRNYYANNSQGNISCNRICNLAARRFLQEISYVIVIDALYNAKQRHMQKVFLSTIIDVIILVMTTQIIRNMFSLYVMLLWMMVPFIQTQSRINLNNDSCASVSAMKGKQFLTISNGEV